MKTISKSVKRATEKEISESNVITVHGGSGVLGGEYLRDFRKSLILCYLIKALVTGQMFKS